MHEQEWEKEGMHGEWGHKKMGPEIMLWKYLSEEQMKELLVRKIELKIKKKGLMISMMRDKVRLMEDKLDMLKSVRDMLKSGR